MDKKTIMKMNDTWKNFRLTESLKIFKGFAKGINPIKIAKGRCNFF